MLETDRSRRLTALSFVVGLTVWRIGFLAVNGTDLFVDESQYWLWGQELDFGYYSKPPMIAWLLRAVTEISGSDSQFWVRAPAPVLHMFTALILMALARSLYGEGVAAWVGPVYIALPIVTVGSALMSTDTVMLPFFGLALLMFFRCTKTHSPLDALMLGVVLGLGLLSKYGAIYFVLGAVLVTIFQPARRLERTNAALATAAAAIVFSPNILWNITHEATTVRHTLDNADWRGDGLHLTEALQFFLSQSLVIGPVLFAALVWALFRFTSKKSDKNDTSLLLFSVPILALVTGQALMSKAYANWAVAAYLTGIILAIRILINLPRLLVAAQAINLTFALIIPVLLVAPDGVSLGKGKPLFARYLGRAEVSLKTMDTATKIGLSVIVAQDRALLADLKYTLRDQPVRIFALPHKGFAQSYYEQSFPVPSTLTQDTVFLTRNGEPPCPDARLLETWTLGFGTFSNATFSTFQVPPACYLSEEPHDNST